ncbi:MAG TPA: VanZ family protein [Longimicrobium sp.]
MKPWLRWAPALLCMAAIFVASARPTIRLPDVDNSDKMLHFAAYAGLGALLAYGGAASAAGRLPLIAIGTLYGASDEVHQSFVPGRTPDLLDWVADTLGAIAGVLAAHRFFSRRRARAAVPGADPLRR